MITNFVNINDKKEGPQKVDMRRGSVLTRYEPVTSLGESVQKSFCSYKGYPVNPSSHSVLCGTSESGQGSVEPMTKSLQGVCKERREVKKGKHG